MKPSNLSYQHKMVVFLVNKYPGISVSEVWAKAYTWFKTKREFITVVTFIIDEGKIEAKGESLFPLVKLIDLDQATEEGL